MDQDLEDLDRVSQLGVDQDFEGAIGTGGADPALTDCAGAHGGGGESARDTDLTGEGLARQVEQGADFLDTSGQPFFTG